jgi:hypothetical protein
VLIDAAGIAIAILATRRVQTRRRRSDSVAA